jgi:hypothetical protein
MGEFHSGRVSGINAAGARVERRLLEFQDQIKFEKGRLTGVDECLALFRKIEVDLQKSSLSLEQKQLVEKWFQVIQSMLLLHRTSVSDVGIQIQGALTATQELVGSLKKFHDVEERREKEIEEYNQKENKTLQDLKDRPPGADVGFPLKEMMSDPETTTVQEVPQEKKRKKTRGV